ncbi:MAG: DUF927 domain-containing protein [Pseudomonadota bacterium]
MTLQDVKKIIDAATIFEMPIPDITECKQEASLIFPHGYRITPTGIEYLKGSKGQGGEYDDWKWLCSHLIVTAHVCNDNDHNFGRILEYTNSNGRTKEHVMPMEHLSGNGEELRKELLSRGVIMATENEARHRLNAYISSSNPIARAICVDEVGWFRNQQYLLADKVYGQQNGERVVFQSKGIAPKNTHSGSLAEWQEHVGKYIDGNPILCLSVCTALAAPLLHLLGEENFAIHISGSSSIGKTTAARVARSICGNEIHSWRTTDNAAESLARNSNDGCLIFDELGEVDAKSADNMAYMLGNGSGKARANKRGDARPVNKFRIVILSTGEVGLESKLAEIGKAQRAGQAVRFIEIQADCGKGFGIYKELHGLKDGEQLSNHLKQASELYSGTVMDAWLTYITQDKERQEYIVNITNTLRDGWINKFVPSHANEQVKRCGRKFALLAAVGEITKDLRILPQYSSDHNVFEPILGALSESINELFQSWSRSRGENFHELTEIIKALRCFINLHGSSRFETPWKDKNHDSEYVDMDTSHTLCDQRTHNRAGYKRLVDNKWHYYFYQNVFVDDVLKGKNNKTFLSALADKGILQKETSGNTTCSIRIPGEGQKRVYCILPDAINMGDENE